MLLLTTKEVAERLKVKPVTVRRWVAQGKLAPITFSQTCLRFSEDYIDRWLTDHQDAALADSQRKART